MPRVISIDAPPGTLRDLVTDISKHQVIMLPTSTSETNHSTTKDALLECLQNAIHRISHISRCENAEDTIVCTHWFDVPIQINRKERPFISNFLMRHVESLIRAYGLESKIEHHAVILDIDTAYAFEILLEDLAAGSTTTSQVAEYMADVKRAAGPSATIIPVSSRLFDTPYLRRELATMIIKTKPTYGFQNDTTRTSPV